MENNQDTDDVVQSEKMDDDTSNEFKMPAIFKPSMKLKPHKQPENENKEPSPPVPYEEPDWKGTTDENYYLEELKSGVIAKTIDLRNKSFVAIGRIDSCEITMAHPTVSRFHAVLQYKGVKDSTHDKGFYLYDLKSTHGTFLNKYRIMPKLYTRVKVGHMIKIGCSSRLFVLQGPQDDEEDESELSVTELRKKRLKDIEDKNKREEEEKLQEQQEKERQEKLLEERGISWGMAEDADEETDLSVNPYAVDTNEELYLDDPRKALKMWYEKEGAELSYEAEKAEKGMFVVKLILPIDDNGREIVIETSAKNKKEAKIQCALEACRAIDKLGLLRPAKRESKKVQKRNWEENDYYDSDEDSFFDRTGDLDKKRQKRMKKAGKIQDTVETYETLLVKHNDLLNKLQDAQRKLTELTTSSSKLDPELADDVDELDAYMKNLKSTNTNKLDLKKAKDDVATLTDEETHLRKLINIAKPTSMPELLKPKIEPVANEKQKFDSKRVERKENMKNLEINQDTEDTDQSLEDSGEKKVIGPTLPSDLSGGKLLKKSKKRVKEVLDEDFCDLTWQPPKGQTGDGRTALNDKLGY